MTVLETVRELPHRYVEGLKSTQDTLVDYNERLADAVVDSLPELPDFPYFDQLPKPIEVVDSYFGYLTQVHEANKSFATRLVKAWDRPEAPAAKPAAKKPAAKKTTARKRTTKRAPKAAAKTTAKADTES